MSSQSREDEQIIEWLRSSQAAQGSPHPSPLRIAGGWVRCRELDESRCHDFDVVLTDCTADEYAKYFASFMAGLHPTDHRIQVRMLMPNSDKYRAQHIAKVELRSPRVSFDFTQARASPSDVEVTDRCSVTQSMIYDARRRDFTVNALYHNLTTGLTEDPLGVGLHHLDERLLVCCEDGHKTFLEDPIRVLRAARFISGEAELALSDDLIAAAEAPAVLQQLIEATPEDRYRSEIIRMLKLPHYDVGLAFLLKLPGVLARASSLMQGCSAKEWYRKQQIDIFLRDHFDETDWIETS